jgi:hypothetical protein
MGLVGGRGGSGTELTAKDREVEVQVEKTGVTPGDQKLDKRAAKREQRLRGGGGRRRRRPKAGASTVGERAEEGHSARRSVVRVDENFESLADKGFLVHLMLHAAADLSEECEE